MMIWPILSVLFLVTLEQAPFRVSAQVHFKKGVPFVKLANGGLLSGTVKFSRDERGYYSFTGIPYATIPSRFEESEPITGSPWEGIFSATKPGALCPQIPFGLAGNPDGMIEAEDCLNLNVYVSMNASSSGKDYPVLFWVHGGGFFNGNGFGHGPKYFMDEPVILVTINYRLGSFGFLSTGDTVIPGNNGLKDMVVALKWVQENIKKFGGDPGKVTIFGESAGGAATHYLLLSPTTKGLFHRAISQSGSALSPWAYQTGPRHIAVELATHLKCPTIADEPSGIKSEEILDCLKGLTMDELKLAQMTFKTSWPMNMKSFFFGPTTEPSDPVSSLTPFLSEPPISMLTRKDSKIPEIPWMVGANEDEGAVMYAGAILFNPELLKELNTEWEKYAPHLLDYANLLSVEEQQKVSQTLKEFYFGTEKISDETRQQFSNLFTDQLFLHGVYKSAMETASKGKKNRVYLYQYSRKGPVSSAALAFQITGEAAEKCGHGDDQPHLFNFEYLREVYPGAAGGPIKFGETDVKFSKNFVKLWTSFAIHGEPKHSWGNAVSKSWKSISKKQLDGVEPLKWFRIDEDAGTEELDQSVKDRMQIWDDIWSKYLAPAMMNKHKPAETQTQKTEL